MRLATAVWFRPLLCAVLAAVLAATPLADALARPPAVAAKAGDVFEADAALEHPDQIDRLLRVAHTDRVAERDLDAAHGEQFFDDIDDGVEYPDAHCHVARLFGLTVREGEILTDMYDEYCEEGK